MQSRPTFNLKVTAPHGERERAVETELNLLRDVLRMLPAAVTIQDEDGDFLLVNDAAAAQLGIVGGAPAAPLSAALNQRRETGLELLRSGRAAIAEECIADGHARQVLLTSHRPVRIAERNLLLSASADISEQKSLRGPVVPFGVL